MIITGGGTGGHLFPGIAVAEAMISRFPLCKVMFICPGRPIDKQALNLRAFETATIKCRGLRGKGAASKLQALSLLPSSVLAAAKIIRNFKPDLVLGVGGYVTGPVILAARLLAIPCCIHEQNSVPGLANRLLGYIVQQVFISFPDSKAYFPERKTVLSGNPVRQELLPALQPTRSKNADQDQKDFNLLVLGGSQGAHRVNTLVLEAIQDIKHALPPGFQVIHQTGAQDEKYVKERYAGLGITAQVAAFFQNMAETYQKADLVVSRAGATTLTELMVLKKPAILIPYPYAADNHQEKNGRFLVNSGGAKMFLETKLTGMELGREILDLLTDREMLLQMAEKIGKLSRPQVMETIINGCLTLLRGL